MRPAHSTPTNYSTRIHNKWCVEFSAVTNLTDRNILVHQKWRLNLSCHSRFVLLLFLQYCRANADSQISLIATQPKISTMNFHQRSLSEQPQRLRPQQSPSIVTNNNNNIINNNNDANGTTALMDTNDKDGPTASLATIGGEILHSDSQQSLDRLFNPASMPSYTPLRDRNLPASFFSPPWKSTTTANGQESEEEHEKRGVDSPAQNHHHHQRSISFDQRNRVHTQTQQQHRRTNNLHMRTQSTLAPMTSLMRQESAITESSPSVLSGASSRGQLNSDIGSSELMSSPHGSGTMFSAHHIDEPNLNQHHHQRLNNHQFSNQNPDPSPQPAVADQASIVHAGHPAHNMTRQPVTTYGPEGRFVDTRYLIEQSPLDNNSVAMTDQHIHQNEPKFHVAHSTYVTSTSMIQRQQQFFQQRGNSSEYPLVPPFEDAGELIAARDGYFSSGTTMSHSCSNSDFHSGSCSSLHSRSQSCQSSVLDSSMSNLGIGGSSSNLTRDSTVTPMFDYVTPTTPVAQQQPPSMPYGSAYNQAAQQQPQMFGAQTAVDHHQQLYQNPLPEFNQRQAYM